LVLPLRKGAFSDSVAFLLCSNAIFVLGGAAFLLCSNAIFVLGGVAFLLCSNAIFSIDRFVVTGDLHWAQVKIIGNGGSISGSLVKDSPSQMQCHVPSAPIQSGIQSIEIPNDDSRSLTPGDYGAVMIRARSVLSLSEGLYRFSKFEVEPDAVLLWEGQVKIEVTGTLRVGDRSRIEGTPLADFLVGSNVDLGTDAWMGADIQAPDGHVRVASRTLLQGRLLSKTIRFEPDAQVYVNPVIRVSPFDATLLRSSDTIDYSDYLQASFRLSELDVSRNQTLSHEQRLELLNLYGSESEYGRLIPIVSLEKSFVGIENNQRTQNMVRMVALGTAKLHNVYAMGFNAPSVLQEMAADPVIHYTLELQDHQFIVPMDSTVWIPTPPNGTWITTLNAHRQSGQMITQYFPLEIENEILEDWEQ